MNWRWLIFVIAFVVSAAVIKKGGFSGTIEKTEVLRGPKGEVQIVYLRRGDIDQRAQCIGAPGKKDPNFSRYREGDEIIVEGTLRNLDADAAMTVYPCTVMSWQSKGR